MTPELRAVPWRALALFALSRERGYHINQAAANVGSEGKTLPKVNDCCDAVDRRSPTRLLCWVIDDVILRKNMGWRHLAKELD